MNIAIVGTGYVGLVSGTCFSEMGMNVTCVDIDARKIENLNKGIIPIYEPGLEDLVQKNMQDGRLHFTTSLQECIDESNVVIIAVGTPPGEDGSADLSYVLEVARTFGRLINKYTLLVTKSTVPVGTAYKIKEVVNEELAARGVEVPFDVASNPEFLKEGAAIKDFMSPDRIVIGVDSPRAQELMERIYRPFQLNNYRVIIMDVTSSEMAKYAANAMLATRISFMNEMARLCEATGANIDKVRAGISTDNRIGSKFLYPGCGYGGSCFPKDVKALIKTGEEYGVQLSIVEAVENVNNAQKRVVFDKLHKALCRSAECGTAAGKPASEAAVDNPASEAAAGKACAGSLAGKTVAIWGLAFKPETDDMREAPSVTIINLLLEAGANVRAFDPIAMPEAKAHYFSEAYGVAQDDTAGQSANTGEAGHIARGSIYYATDIYDAAQGADAIAMVTEWRQFRMPNWGAIKAAMKGNIFVDGRNIYSPTEMKELGFEYYSIGK